MRKILIALLLFLLLTGCAPKKTLDQAIIGTWADSNGYKIQFSSGGKGFIPGVAGKIPDSDFAYAIKDEQHINVEMQGIKVTIEIQIKDDTLTWKDSLGEVIYNRVKE
jgi:hypothetical protein